MNMRTLAAAVAVAPLFLLVGCGGADDTASSADVSSQTAEQSSSEPTGSTEAGAGLTAASFAQRVNDAQLEAGTTHVRMTMDAAGQPMSMEGDISAGKTLDDTAMDVTMEMAGQSVGMILVDRVLYMQMGQLTQGKYIELALDDPDNPLGAQFDQILANADPTKSIEAMGRAITDFQQVGTENIDGQPTTQYAVTLDTEKLYRAMGSGDLGGAAGVPDTIDYTMYVGGDDLLRRMELDLQGTTMTLDFTEWGEPVDIEAPAPSEISKQNPFSRKG